MKPPFLTVEFSNGDVFQVPLSIHASNRAEYYASKEVGTDYYRVLKEELAVAMEDPIEAMDWLVNNMNWPEIAPFAVKVERPQRPFDHAKEFSNATVQIVELDSEGETE